MAPGDLDKALCGLTFPEDPNVLVGLSHADDAGVYRISEDTALIQTIDFFTPIVKDPRLFGRIAAANALSDVYAMGGIPKTAMNLVCFPSKEVDLKVLREIIKGGIHTLKEADTVLVGGHSIEDHEIKYGLSVTGVIHPNQVLVKTRPGKGDRLVLTKPLGTGIITTAEKAGLVPKEIYEQVVDQMAELNKTPARVMADFDISACTDITGFGLLGHLAEMIQGTQRGLELFSAHIPMIPKAAELAEMGFLPTAAYNNKTFREPMIRFSPTIPQSTRDILFDPQTSGGLLMAVKSDQAHDLVHALKENGVRGSALIGRVTQGPEELIQVN